MINMSSRLASLVLSSLVFRFGSRSSQTNFCSALLRLGGVAGACRSFRAPLARVAPGQPGPAGHLQAAATPASRQLWYVEGLGGQGWSDISSAGNLIRAMVQHGGQLTITAIVYCQFTHIGWAIPVDVRSSLSTTGAIGSQARPNTSTRPSFKRTVRRGSTVRRNLIKCLPRTREST